MQKKKTERFVVWIRVKPYVKKYLLNNFHVQDKDWPELVNVDKDRVLKSFITLRLAKPTHRRDKREEKKAAGKVMVPLEISKQQFYYNGWALTATDERMFARALEVRCETICKTFLTAMYFQCGNLTECIRHFYHTFGITDEDWPMDTIRKMWQRDKVLPKIACKKQEKDEKTVNYKKITQFILGQLSQYGTISQEGLKQYENSLNKQ